MKYFVCALAAITSIPVSAAAQEQPLEHVLVSVPIHKKQAQTALPVTVLSGDELRRQAATSIGETLGSKPGIANASFGPGVGRPVIRGQQGPRAITLQNGILSADVSGLSPDHAVGVEALLADSIEVLRGPSTLLYGGGAIGGVVNVIDNRVPRARIDGLQGAFEYRYDEAPDMDSGVFKLEGGNGNLAFHLSGSTRETENLEIPGYAIDEAALEEQEELLGGHEEEEDHEEEEVENTRGYIANTDSESDNVNLGISYHFGEDGFVGFSVSRLESEYGIPPGAHGHEEEHEEGEEEHADEEDHEGEEEEETIRIDMEQTRYDAMVHLHNPFNGLEIMRSFLSYTDYNHKELEGAEIGTTFDRETWEGRLELVHKPIGDFHGVVGLQWRADEFVAEGEEAYVPETDSTELGLFIVEDFHQGDWTYEAGVRGDWVERDPDAQSAGREDYFALSVSGSALWQFAPRWSTGLSLSRAQRAPSTEELFSNVDAGTSEEFVTHAATGLIEVGDADLDEETSLNADLTLTWAGDQSWAELGIFYNQFEDYIYLFNSGTDVDETPVFLYQQEDAEFYGVEFDSEFHLMQLGAGNLTLGLSGDFVSGEFDDAGDVPRLPPQRLGAKLSWSSDSFSTWVGVQDADEQDDPGEFETGTEGYTRWDAGADYRFAFSGTNELLLFLKWKNISDEEIRLSTSFLRNVAPEAGRSIVAGLRLTF